MDEQNDLPVEVHILPAGDHQEVEVVVKEYYGYDEDGKLVPTKTTIKTRKTGRG